MRLLRSIVTHCAERPAGHSVPIRLARRLTPGKPRLLHGRPERARTYAHSAEWPARQASEHAAQGPALPGPIQRAVTCCGFQGRPAWR
jgi:hypothetical protein